MPDIRIFIDDKEVDPCVDIRTILVKLSSCENELGQRLRGLLAEGPSRQRLPDSTKLLQRRSDGSVFQTGTSSGQPVSGAEFFVDPDSEPDFPTFIDPRSNLAGRLGGGPHQAFGNMIDTKGLPVRVPLVPLDLKLMEAIRGKHKDSLIGDLIVGLSKATARLLRVPQETVSEYLAVQGNTTINAVHLEMLRPLLKAAPGGQLVSKSVGEFLKDQADIALLQGGSGDPRVRDVGLRDLEKQVEVLDRGFDFPFISTSTERERDVYDRIRGNLEILRIQRQEEF